MNPILIKIGNIVIYWYSFILLIGFLIGSLLVIKEAKKLNIKKELIEDFLVFGIPICLIGARLYYVFFEYKMYIDDPISILRVWEGGLAIHGGIIAGFIFLMYFTKKHNLKINKMLDILVVGLIIGQIIGRWGNFMNSEAYGPKTTYSFLKKLCLPNFIIDGMHINGEYRHPTFLYESLWNFVGLITILVIRRKNFNKIGFITSFYLVWYGIGRCLIESLRKDSLYFLGIKVAQLISIIMIFIGIGYFIYSYKKGDKYE